MKFQNISSLLDEKWTKIPKAGQKGLIEREGVENLDGKCPFLILAWFEMENKSKLFDKFCDLIFWVIGAVFSTEKISGYQYQIANTGCLTTEWGFYFDYGDDTINSSRL